MNVYFFVCVFYAEVQDGRQKWHGNNFWEKSPVDSADTLGVKNIKIALSQTVTDINAFTQKLKMATKNGGKTNYADTLGVKHFVEITLSRIVSETNAYLRCTLKFKMASKMVGK